MIDGSCKGLSSASTKLRSGRQGGNDVRSDVPTYDTLRDDLAGVAGAVPRSSARSLPPARGSPPLESPRAGGQARPGSAPGRHRPGGRGRHEPRPATGSARGNERERRRRLHRRVCTRGMCSCPSVSTGSRRPPRRSRRLRRSSPTRNIRATAISPPILTTCTDCRRRHLATGRGGRRQHRSDRSRPGRWPPRTFPVRERHRRASRERTWSDEVRQVAYQIEGGGHQ